MSIPANGFYFILYLPFTNYENVGSYNVVVVELLFKLIPYLILLLLLLLLLLLILLLFLLRSTGSPVLIEINFCLEHSVESPSLCTYCELIFFLLLILICSKFFSLSFSAYLNFSCYSTRNELLNYYNKLCRIGLLSLYFRA